MRAFERALRRAGLPLLMTEGYNPRPRLSFPLSLGVGTEGSDEVMEFELADWVPASDVRTRLAAQLPPDLELKSLELTRPGRRVRVVETRHVVRPYASQQADCRIDSKALRDLLDRAEILVTRRRKGRLKEVNIRPFVMDLRLEGNAILMTFRVGPEGTARPEEILAALGVPPGQCHVLYHIERTQVLLASPHRRETGSRARSKEP